MMAFQLHIIDVDTGWTAEVVLADADQELLGRQMARCVEQAGLDWFAQWLGRTLVAALPDAVDYDLKPPSEAQVNYAMAIARALRVSLTPDVLRYRGAMHEFLSTHKEAFDTRRKSRSRSPPAVEASEQEAP